MLQAGKGMEVAIKEQKCFAHTMAMLYLTDYNEGKGEGEGKESSVNHVYLFCPHTA